MTDSLQLMMKLVNDKVNFMDQSLGEGLLEVMDHKDAFKPPFS